MLWQLDRLQAVWQLSQDVVEANSLSQAHERCQRFPPVQTIEQLDEGERQVSALECPGLQGLDQLVGFDQLSAFVRCFRYALPCTWVVLLVLKALEAIR